MRAKSLMATTPTILSQPILVANLPLPPDLAAELDRDWRSYRFSRSERASLEADVKLRHHCAGHYVIATVGRRGMEIHALDLNDPDEVNELHKRLRAQGYRHIYNLFPIPVAGTESEIITLNAES
jgi:hypothetical protein